MVGLDIHECGGSQSVIARPPAAAVGDQLEIQTLRLQPRPTD